MTTAAADLVTFPLPAAQTAPAGDQAQDGALVDAARRGDRDAFGQLVVRHERAVLRAAVAALGSADEADEVAQDAFLTAWRKLGGFRGESSFRTWLLTIAWRKALDRRRRRRLSWRRRARVTPAAEPLDACAGTEPDPERAAVAGDLAARARSAIGRLSPRLRDTLLLAASGQYRYEEIADMLKVPIGTVKWRVAEARRRVTADLESGATRRGAP